MKYLKIIFICVFILFSNNIFSQTISALGIGIDNAARTLFADTTTVILYVGGYFNNAGGILVNKIARWDGSSWDSLGSGIVGNVTTITKYRDTIFAGGNLYAYINGNLKELNIAKWNGIKISDPLRS